MNLLPLSKKSFTEAVKGSPFSASLSGSCYLMSPRFNPISVKIPFFDGPLRSRFVSVCCHNPNSDSFIVDQTVHGSKNPAHLADDHPQASASSPSSAIDFLTLCHRLKVIYFGFFFFFLGIIFN